MSLTNLEIAELLARSGEKAEGHRRKAYERASRAALLWSEEAAEVVGRGDPASSLEALGDRLGARVESWLDSPPALDGEPPPKRSGFSTYATALRTVADKTEWTEEVLGDLQMHTTFSDGKASVRDMALGAAGLGREFIAVTDHSQSLSIVRGMDEATLARQGEEIRTVNEDLAEEQLDFTVLRAIEMDLDLEGAGDTDPTVLAELDLVLGSFHTKLREKGDQTARYLAALNNPDVHVMAHPKGRKWNVRPGLEADWDAVIAEAARLDKALETNAYPHRQDLSAELLPRAAAAGVRVSIGTDAHDPTELRFLEVGLAAAMTAGVPRERILNFMPVAELRAWVASLRNGA